MQQHQIVKKSQFKIQSTIIAFIYSIDSILAIALCTAYSVFYTIRGGFLAVYKTDALQFVLMYLGFVCMIAFLFFEHGGYSFLSSKLTADMLSFPGKLDWSYIFAWGFIALVTFIDPNFYHRAFAGQSPKTVKRGILISVCLWFVFDVISISVGLYAAALIPEAQHSPFLDLINVAVPSVLKGLFLISMLSVVMSTIDSFILVSGFTIGRNIVSKFRKSDERSSLVYLKA